MEEPIVTFGSESLILEMSPKPVTQDDSIPETISVSIIPEHLSIPIVPTPEPVPISASVTKKGWCVLS